MKGSSAAAIGMAACEFYNQFVDCISNILALTTVTDALVSATSKAFSVAAEAFKCSLQTILSCCDFVFEFCNIHAGFFMRAKVEVEYQLHQKIVELYGLFAVALLSNDKGTSIF